MSEQTSGLGTEVCNVLLVIPLFWTCNSCSLYYCSLSILLPCVFPPWTRVPYCCLLEDHRIKITASASESRLQKRTNRQIGCTSKWDNAHLQHCQQKPCGSGFTASRRYLEVRAVGEKDVHICVLMWDKDHKDVGEKGMCLKFED